MIQYSERHDAVNIDLTAASNFSVGADGSLVPLLKRYLLSWTASGVLLGGLIVFSPLIDGGTTRLPVMIIRLSLLGAALSWTFHQMRQSSISLKSNRLVPLVVLLLAWAGLSMLWAPYKNASIQWLMSLLCYAALFGLVVQGIRKSLDAGQVLALVITMGLFEAVLGIIQYVWLGEPRAKGTFFNPNFFATYEVVVSAVIFALLVFIRANEINGRQKWLLWSIGAVTFVAFLLAQSRGASLALVVAATFIGWYRFGKTALLILILCLIAGVIIPNPLTQRMSQISTQDPYAFSRVDIWKNSVERIIDRPMGFGLGMYKYVSFQYRFPLENNIVRYGKRAESAHNEYLQIAVELGVGGLVIFLLGIGIWAREVKAVLGGELEPWERGLVTGLTGAVLGIFVHGAVDSVFHEPSLVILLIVCGGLVFAFQSIKGPDMAEWRVPFSYYPMQFALVLLCGGLLAIPIIQSAAGWYANQRGEAEAHVGRPDLALQWFHRASLIDPGTTAYHDAAARTSVQLFYQSGDPHLLARAVEEEQFAIELNPLDGRFPYRLGTIYDALARQRVSNGQREFLLNQAAQAYEQAIQTDPYAPLSYMGLADIRLPQMRQEEARSWLRQAVTYEPNFLPARLRLAELYLNDGNIEDAQSEVDAIVAARKKYEGWVLGDLERQFLDVNPSSLRRALALRAQR